MTVVLANLFGVLIGAFLCLVGGGDLYRGRLRWLHAGQPGRRAQPPRLDEAIPPSAGHESERSIALSAFALPPHGGCTEGENDDRHQYRHRDVGTIGDVPKSRTLIHDAGE